MTNGWTIWFTGLSGSGKSTLACALSAHLKALNMGHELLDGDEVRRELCRDLGFSKEDRDENVRRIGYLARVLNRHGIICIVAAISPYRSARAEVRSKISQFLEVHVDCPLDVLIHRDVKGLYHRAISGELPYFTGVSDPYEPPLAPDAYVNSGSQSLEESLSVILARIEDRCWLPSGLNHRLASFSR
jgi:adenylyl-sulfate kinase